MVARRKEDLSDREAARPQGAFKLGVWSILCFFAQTNGDITVKTSDFAAKGLARIFGCNPLLGCLGIGNNPGHGKLWWLGGRRI